MADAYSEHIPVLDDRPIGLAKLLMEVPTVFPVKKLQNIACTHKFNKD